MARKTEAEAQANQAVEDKVEIIEVYDEDSVYTFESALDEDDRSENIHEMHRRMDWIGYYGEFRTLHPIDHFTYMFPGWGSDKITNYHYLMRMIQHEEINLYQGCYQ